MPRLSIEDLRSIRDKGKQALAARSGVARVKVTVYMGECGIAAGAREVVKTLLQEIEREGICDVVVAVAPCDGRCGDEPAASVEAAGQAPVRYARLDASKTVRILKEHVLRGRVVTEFALP